MFRVLTAHAQDPSFSNVVKDASYFHPAYTLVKTGWEINTIMPRRQWYGVGKSFTSQFLSINYESDKNMGIGASVLSDKEGPGGLKTLNPKFIYRFNILGYNRKCNNYFRGGNSLTLSLYAGILHKSIDDNDLIFSDQQQWPYNTIQPSEVIFANEKATVFDAGFSASYNFKIPAVKLWITSTLSVHHLQSGASNSSEASLLGKNTVIPPYWIWSTVFYPNGKDRMILKQPYIQYERQGNLHKMSLGILIGINQGDASVPFYFGLGGSGQVNKTVNRNVNSMIVMAGVELLGKTSDGKKKRQPGLNLCLSYETPFSGLKAGQPDNAYGTFELSVSLLLNKCTGLASMLFQTNFKQCDAYKKMRSTHGDMDPKF